MDTRQRIIEKFVIPIVAFIDGLNYLLGVFVSLEKDQREGAKTRMMTRQVLTSVVRLGFSPSVNYEED